MPNLTIFDLQDYGAIANGTTKDTTAVQAAIDAALNRAAPCVRRAVYLFAERCT